MRKLLLSTIVLTAFSASIIVFQMSCQKTADAQTTDVTGFSPDKTLISKSVQLQIGTKTDSSGSHPIYVNAGDYFLINNDGTNLTKISIPLLPAGEYPMAGLNSALLSNDGKKIIFQSMSGNFKASIYALNLTNGSLVKLIDNSSSSNSYQLLDTK